MRVCLYEMHILAPVIRLCVPERRGINIDTDYRDRSLREHRRPIPLATGDVKYTLVLYKSTGNQIPVYMFVYRTVIRRPRKVALIGIFEFMGQHPAFLSLASNLTYGATRRWCDLSRTVRITPRACEKTRSGPDTDEARA